MLPLFSQTEQVIVIEERRLYFYQDYYVVSYRYELTESIMHLDVAGN